MEHDRIAEALTIGGTTACDPKDIPGIGSVAYFAAPNGAFFALWQPTKTNCCT